MVTRITQLLGLCLVCAIGVPTFAAEGRQLEEVIVTAERKEASISDTSISITALTSEFIDDFGIRNQSDLQNLIPATTIQPYDAAVRGVGRNFRNLGGDPGISTYINGAYSEDLYTATIGSLWDLERVEVLRGPQGTLYGRNAVGGAINFLYKKPTDEFEGSLKTVLGDFDTQDYYGVISGPIIEGRLNGRLTASSRRHDGWVEERGIGPDLDSGDEKNFALQFEWLISDSVTANLRSNRAKVDRIFGGADGGGLIVLSGENFESDQQRNFNLLTNSLRAVDANETDPLNSAFVDQSQPILNFTNPATGENITGQRVRPGVDRAGNSGARNQGFGSTLDQSDCVFLDRDNIDGDDLCAFTNGLNNETFNQQGNQLDVTWDVSENLSIKYILGLNDFLYERITDDDNSASLVNDRQFYVSQEANYRSHELQAFWDITPSFSLTSGVFFYDSTINQRGDFFSSVSAPQFFDPAASQDNFLSVAAPGVVPGDPALTFLVGPAIDINSARLQARADGAARGEFTSVAGAFLGDATLGRVNRGPETPGTDLQYETTSDRQAFAAYTQSVWDINDKFTLTTGIRYAVDELDGEENLARYAELDPTVLNVPDLATLNIVRGAVDPATLQLTGAVDPFLDGVPISFGGFRELKRRDEKITWRVNLDYAVTDDALIYLNATTGFRAGGFNLVFFSQTPEFEPEELIAYELGYKGTFFDGSMQLNASAYLYDYDTIHTRTEEACPPGGTIQSAQSACAVSNSTTSIQAAPGAEVIGAEVELLWLATDRLTLGGNISYTDTEYTESFLVVDGSDPTIAGQVFNADNNPDRARDIKGNRLLQVPESKASAYAVYNFPLGDAGNLDFTLSYSYISEVFFSAFETELDRAPSYDRFDLRASWKSASENWIVSGFVNNVLDEIGIRQIIPGTSAQGFRRTAQVTEPRHFGAEITYSFK